MANVPDDRFTSADAQTIKYKVRTVVGHCGYRADDAADLEQRLAIRVWKAMHKYDPTKGARSTFLKTVLENTLANIIAHDKAKKRDRRMERPLDTAGEGPTDERDESPTDRDRRLDVGELVDRLPEDLRATARLLMVMSPAEVARQPGMTRGKVRQGAAHIRRYFQKFLGESQLPQPTRQPFR